MSESEQKQINIEDMTPQQSLEALWTLMNKAATKGCFNIDESYVLKVLFSKVTRHFAETTDSQKHDLSGVFNQNNTTTDNKDV